MNHIESKRSYVDGRPSSVMVIGGTGYLGRYLTQHAVTNGIKVIIGSRSISQDDYPSAQIDVRNPLSIELALREYRPSHVINFAGLMSGSLHEMTETNVVGSVNLLEAVRAQNNRTKVTLIGSAAEYGEGGGAPIGENSKHNPLGDYGLSKSLQSAIVPFFAKRGVEVNIARIFNVDGESMPPHTFPGRVDSQLGLLRQGKISEVLVGDLGAVRDYLHPEAVAQKVLQVAIHGSSGEAYNVASGKGVSNLELLEARLIRAGLPLDVIRPDKAYNSSRSGGLVHSVASISKHEKLPKLEGL